MLPIPTSAAPAAQGRTLKLKHGWVAVVNRGQADLNKNVSGLASQFSVFAPCSVSVSVLDHLLGWQQVTEQQPCRQSLHLRFTLALAWTGSRQI